MVTNKSPPTHSPPLPPQASNPPSYATWERTHSGSGLAGGRTVPGSGGPNQGTQPSNLVAPPLGSAPPVAMRGHTSQMGGSSVHSSMSNLANAATNPISALPGGHQPNHPGFGHAHSHQKQLSSPPVVTSSDSVDHSWQYRPPNVVQQAKTAVLSRQLSSGGEEGLTGGGGRIYPHVPPRASKAGMGVGMSMGVARSSQGSSSSSIDSLTSGSSSKGMEGVTSAPNSAPPTGIGSHRSPLAAPRTSLTGTSSAPISAQEGGSSSYSSSHNSRKRALDVRNSRPISKFHLCSFSDSPLSGSQSSSSNASESRRVRTLYACVAEHETELSFEPNQIITNGKCPFHSSSKWQD